MAYKGKYKVKNISKYLGDPAKVRFLSLWEYSLMKYLDACVNVVGWCSEDVKIPYICGTDNQKHLIFPVPLSENTSIPLKNLFISGNRNRVVCWVSFTQCLSLG